MQFIPNGPEIPEQLLEAHEEGNVVFFCGAGVSYPAGLPGFEGLTEQIFSDLNVKPSSIEKVAMDTRQFDTAINLMEGRLVEGRSSVRKQLFQILTPNFSIPNATATHEALLSLGRHREGKLRLITTNFDRVFEKVLNDSGQSAKRHIAPNLPLYKNRWEGLVYLHGLLPKELANGCDLDHLVLSSGDFGLAYIADGWAARFVSQLFRTTTVCFIGYSINDPVLRYMMDALAADRLLGESSPEMFAFGDFVKGEEEQRTNEWLAKNVTPILYEKTAGHGYLHQTLRTWAKVYQDGALGKEHVVSQYAITKPTASTCQDNFVGRMLWALRDQSGIAAKKFADFNPVPSLDWLEPLCGKNPDGRPASYACDQWLNLVDNDSFCGPWDQIMLQIGHWLTRHLNDPKLLMWIYKNDVQSNGLLAQLIVQKLKSLSSLSRNGKENELSEIRKNAPNAIPDKKMKFLWRLYLSNRLKKRERDYELFNWIDELKNEDPLLPTLRFQIRDLLRPCVALNEPLRFKVDGSIASEENEPPTCEVVLSTDNVYSALPELLTFGKEILPDLLSDFRGLLNDTMDLMREFGLANDQFDPSHRYLPSISEHPQNTQIMEWTALIELVREAWCETEKNYPDRAIAELQCWLTIPYPVFRRLVFFGAANSELFSTEQMVEWLIAEDGFWFWSETTKREVMRLLSALAPKLNSKEVIILESVILQGLSSESLRNKMDEQHFQKYADSQKWLRLAILKKAGAVLSNQGNAEFLSLSSRYPQMRLANDQSDEFSSWFSEGKVFKETTFAPKKRRELVEWLRKDGSEDSMFVDDWRESCRNNFPASICALSALALQGEWPVSRWRVALEVWCEEKYSLRSWLRLAKVLEKASPKTIHALSRPLCWWLGSVAKKLRTQQSIFFKLIHCVIDFEYDSMQSRNDDLELAALNHPIGLATNAALHLWRAQPLNDNQKLPDELKELFTKICNRKTEAFRHGRLILSTHAIMLFRVDPEWAIKYLMPHFEWQSSEVEALYVWIGFVSSPRFHEPFLSSIKASFLEAASHYESMKCHKNQYVSLLTFAALELNTPFSKPELTAAVKALPKEGLIHVVKSLSYGFQGSAEQRGEHWNCTVSPFMKLIWPKDKKLQSDDIAENIADLIICAGDAFPNALAQVMPWLSALEDPTQIIFDLSNSELCKKFPEDALAFIDIITGRDPGLLIDRLKTCVEMLRNTGKIEENNSKLIKLLVQIKKHEH